VALRWLVQGRRVSEEELKALAQDAAPEVRAVAREVLEQDG
jgi:hypothetical protein